ncbi:SGNH/GDSL hydrolase family protein [Leptolyngbya sp. CCNP1308]|uniref:SGNH/GDSL hydrolase family protein n=1 Tax=Leptolyngbya sp. CCNP1308 TaxID=3110255 RepID=UPI002B1F86C1|nr:SGNH/GDSL hydrolase family protein [Leptolyngbya sp. CCNP1308]MEA5448960.1 SGNH/GDSL hydrolase family protein [Leptolyngbya sp. CCNP1308]
MASLVSSLLNPLFAGLGPLNIFGSNVLLSGLGNDDLSGGPDDEILLGFWGNNRLFGAGGDDWLLGSPGDDFLDGGLGSNQLISGPGQDTVVLRNDGRVDTVVDFTPGVDRFWLQEGLSFGQIAIAQQGANTTLRYLNQSEPSVILLNVEAASLTAESFQTQALVPSFNSLTIFGDSLSDPGNLFGLTGFFPPFPYSEGRFSNGDLWADYLVDDLGVEPAQVQNLAVGGATTGRDNGLDPLIGSLTGTESNLPGLLDEVDSYLGGLGEGTANSDGLYVVWAGANDLFNLPSDPAAIPDFLAASVANIATAISSLAARGADTFLVPNLPNLGLTPRTLGDGTSEQATALSQAFNAGLADTLEALEQSLPVAIDIIPVDLFGLTTDIIGAPAEFGFTNVTDPLLNQGVLNDPGYFWWDDQHPTTTVHALLADVFQTSLVEAGYLQPSNGAMPALAIEDFATAGALTQDGTLGSYGTGGEISIADTLSPIQAASAAGLAY